MPKETLLALVAAVRAYLARTGETQEQLAAKLGWTQQNFANKLARMERGDVTWDTVEKVAAAIGYEVALVPATKKGRKK